MAAAATRGGRGVSLVLLALVLLIGAEAARQGLAEAADRTQPQIALAVRPADAEAAARLSEARRLAGDAAGARALAVRAVSADPLNTTALRALGLAEEASGRAAPALAVMRAAGELTWRDSTVQAWLMHKDVLAVDTSRFVEPADSLLRRVERPQSDAIYSLVAAAAILRADVTPALAERMALRPRWRLAMIERLAALPAAEARVADLFARLQRAGAGPTVEEAAAVSGQLAARRRYAEAWRIWARHRGGPAARADQVRDGDFAAGPDRSPFLWSTTAQAGASEALVAAPDGTGRALRVDYDGYASPRLTRQLLLLSPGRYRLSWREWVEDGDGARLRWSVLCAAGAADLGGAASGEAGDGWRARSVAVTVPQGCPAQWVALVPDPGERTAPVAVFYTGVRIAPEPNELTAH